MCVEESGEREGEREGGVREYSETGEGKKNESDASIQRKRNTIGNRVVVKHFHSLPYSHFTSNHTHVVYVDTYAHTTVIAIT